ANNHWGAIQRAESSSTSLGDALLVLNGGASPNRLTCNNKSEPGACCNASSCQPGFDVWNDSGLPLDASNSLWDIGPPGRCGCDFQEMSCSCSGWPFGDVTPPDNLEILTTPFSASTSGTPTVTTTGYSVVSPASGCQ